MHAAMAPEEKEEVKRRVFKMLDDMVPPKLV
jgi:hypothetical protein